MRKFLAATIAFTFICGGCAWFGGDNSETTTTSAQASEVSQAEKAVPVEETAVTPPATESKAAKTVKQTGKKSGKNAGAAKSEAQIKSELDAMGHKLAAQSARTLMPNAAHKEVKNVGGQWVASYISVDPERVTTEMRPGTSAGQYVGIIRYQEHFMECRGASREAALKAPCKEVRARNLNELIRYDGRQWQD